MEWINTQLEYWLSPSTEGEAITETKDERQSSNTLQKAGKLSREQLLAFFEAGREQIQSPKFRQKLKDAHLLKQDLEDLITDEQRKIFIEQGIDGDFGIQFLGKVNTLYKEDNEVMSQFLQFVSLEEDAMAEAELPTEIYEQNQRLMGLAKGHAAELMEKLKDLPPDEQKIFLADQVRVLDSMKKQMQPNPSGPATNAMTDRERMSFFSSRHSGN